MPTTVFREFDPEDAKSAIDALPALRPVRYEALAGGTWIEVKRGGGRGGLVFGPAKIVKALGRQRFRVKVDGTEIIIEPWSGYSSLGGKKFWITLEIVF